MRRLGRAAQGVALRPAAALVEQGVAGEVQHLQLRHGADGVEAADAHAGGGQVEVAHAGEFVEPGGQPGEGLAAEVQEFGADEVRQGDVGGDLMALGRLAGEGDVHPGLAHGAHLLDGQAALLGEYGRDGGQQGDGEQDG